MKLIQLINELIITAMEIIGLVFIAFGLGVLASWWIGTAGFLIVSGGALLAAAGLSARQQRPPSPPRPEQPKAPPVTLPEYVDIDPDANGTDSGWRARLRHVLSPSGSVGPGES